MIRQTLQALFKKIFQIFFIVLYGNIKSSIKAEKNTNIVISKINFNEKINYKLYEIKNCRQYTDRIHDTAIITDNKIVIGPSFQQRDNVNSDIKNNIVFTKGTPRLLRKIKGTTLSLLTGGAGNDNFFHWLFDVLPRLGICEKKIDLNQIDYFLLPSISRKFQSETFESLKIPNKKLISSEEYRHIKPDKLIITDHPYMITNNIEIDINNVPKWIIIWLREKFLSQIEYDKTHFPKKIYISREDSESNVAKMRAVTNEDEIKNYLKNENFEIICLSDLSFIQQVKLFYTAECIVGLHGAGFANLSFCKEGTKVIEFVNIRNDYILDNIAKINNLNFKSIRCEASSYDLGTQLGHIKVPLNDLKEKLKI